MSAPIRKLGRAVALSSAMAVCTGALAVPTQRTFVASTGTDANASVACALVAPCRSFAVAIGQTAPGGEVVVLDSAGYGPVTITQAVSIIAPSGVYAGVSVFAGDGVTVNAGASDTVVLRGLAINGIGGANGIVINTAATVDIGRVEVSGFTGHGIRFDGGGTLIVRDSIVRRNAGNGLNASSSNATLTVERSAFDSNTIGILVSGSLSASIASSSATGNPDDGFVAQGGSHMQVIDCRVAARNGAYTGGVRGDGAGTRVQAIRCESTGYSRGYVAANGAVLQAQDSAATGPVGSGTGFLSEVSSSMDVEHSIATGFVYGVAANAGSTARVSNSTMIANQTDFGFSDGGTLYSRQNNTATTTSGTISPLSPL